MDTRTAFDWSTVVWTEYSSNPASATRLQFADIGVNRWWRVARHDYDTNTDTDLFPPYSHERQASRAFHWIVNRHDRIAALAAFRERITTDWTVDVTDQEYITDSRDGCAVTAVTQAGLVITPRKGWSSQGHGYTTMSVKWSDDMTVDGDTVKLYRVGTSITSRSTPGVPSLVKTFRFHPPTI